MKANTICAAYIGYLRPMLLGTDTLKTLEDVIENKVDDSGSTTPNKVNSCPSIGLK